MTQLKPPRTVIYRRTRQSRPRPVLFTNRTTTYAHPTQKPLELAERAIRHSSRRGDLVFDPFLGSGTTLIAAARLSRRSVGVEIEPRHCDTIVRRYIALAGASAVAEEIVDRYVMQREGVAS
ncbi:MAG: site-specific DNA-methyltransferase [Planctomycetota bacterium]